MITSPDLVLVCHEGSRTYFGRHQAYQSQEEFRFEKLTQTTELICDGLIETIVRISLIARTDCICFRFPIQNRRETLKSWSCLMPSEVSSGTFNDWWPGNFFRRQCEVHSAHSILTNAMKQFARTDLRIWRTKDRTWPLTDASWMAMGFFLAKKISELC
jgi:hypothetical protein